MRIECLLLKEAQRNKPGAIVVGIQENKKSLKAYQDILSPKLLKKVDKFISRPGFRIKRNDILTFDIEDSESQKLYITVLSKEPTLEEIRQICGRVLDSISSQGFEAAQIFADSFLVGKLELTDLVEAITEAIDLSSYRFDKFKPRENSKKLNSCQMLFQVKQDFKNLRKSVEIGQSIAESVNFTRDLVNSPANELSPRIFAERASKMARDCGISFRAFGKKELQKMKMGGMTWRAGPL
jgi:leucyl aminopeptidase